MTIPGSVIYLTGDECPPDDYHGLSLVLTLFMIHCTHGLHFLSFLKIWTGKEVSSPISISRSCNYLDYRILKRELHVLIPLGLFQGAKMSLNATCKKSSDLPTELFVTHGTFSRTIDFEIRFFSVKSG